MSLQHQPNAAVLKRVGWNEARVKAFKDEFEAIFSQWGDSAYSCDMAGQQTIYELQDLALRTTLVSGDALSILAYEPRPGCPIGLKIQIIEADRIGNPDGKGDTETVSSGIRINPKSGQPLAAFVYDRHPGAMVPHGGDTWSGSWKNFYSARGTPIVLHHMRKMRPDQVRGIPHLAPVVTKLKELGRYTEAEMRAAVVSAFFTTFIRTENTDLQDSMEEDFDVPANEGGRAESVGRPEYKMGIGAVVRLDENEDITTANPNRPNTAFDGFVQACLRQIAVGLELPFEVLIKHFNSSYSASRAALLDAYVFIRGRREFIASGFCDPIKAAVMEEAIALGLLAAPGFFRDPLLRAAYLNATWAGDSMGSLNPLDEVRAWNEAVEGDLTTRDRAEMEMFGTDYNRTKPQKLREAKDQSELFAARPQPTGPGSERKADRQRKADDTEVKK